MLVEAAEMICDESRHDPECSFISLWESNMEACYKMRNGYKNGQGVSIKK